jgi:hypothetical protein
MGGELGCAPKAGAERLQLAVSSRPIGGTFVSGREQPCERARSKEEGVWPHL